MRPSDITMAGHIIYHRTCSQLWHSRNCFRDVGSPRWLAGVALAHSQPEKGRPRIESHDNRTLPFDSPSGVVPCIIYSREEKAGKMQRGRALQQCKPFLRLCVLGRVEIYR